MRSSDQPRSARLRALDECLRLLEDAQERGEHELAAAAHARVAVHVPALRPAMPLPRAMDLVFDAIGEALPPAGRESEAGVVAGSTEPEALDAAAARVLTERIRHAAQSVSLLLLEAHRRRAWLALRYRSWEEYVRREFQLSRPRSYELLDHARLLLCIHEVTGVLAPGAIPVYAARRLKRHLPEFLATLRGRATGTAPGEVAAVVDEVLDAYLRRMGSRHRRGIDVPRLQAVLHYLTGLPPATDVVHEIRRVEGELDDVDGALQWLDDFAQELRRR